MEPWLLTSNESGTYTTRAHEKLVRRMKTILLLQSGGAFTGDSQVLLMVEKQLDPGRRF